MENKVIDNKTRRYCLYIGLLACLVAVTAMAGHVAAAGWYLADRDGTQEGDLSGTFNSALDDQKILRYYGDFQYGTGYPTTHWSAYAQDPSTSSYSVVCMIKDSGGSEIRKVHLSAPGTSEYYRYDVTRTYSGGTYYYTGYYNGNLIQTYSAAGTTPYYAYWYRSRYSGYGATYFYFMTVGDDAEQNLVLTHPSSYFIAKDFVNPAFSGLYSSYDNQQWSDRFYARYMSDTSGKNITIKNRDTDEVIYSASASGMCGLYQFNLTSIFFESGVPYGFYTVLMDGSTQSQDIEYRGITTSGTSVEWDESEYVEYDDATITYSISEEYWLTDDYTYKLTVEDADFDEMTYWSIITRPTSAEKELTIYSSVFPESGYYYTCLYAVDKSSGEEILMCYDYAYVYMPGSGEVIVEGETYDATTGNLLGECVVTATQGGTPTSDTSDATDATYQITGLVTDSSIGVNATKTSYVGYPIYFTPYEGGHYEVDVPLVPSGGASPGEWQEVTGGQLTQINHNNTTTTYYNLTEDGTAIGGLVYEAPYWNMCDGATVTLSNATWNTNTTTGDGGWYQINNISAGGNYNFCCEKDGFSTVNETITVTAASFNRQDCYLNGDFTLTINIKNLDTSTTITDEVSVSLDSGETTTTSTGTCTFEDLDYGYYTITGECVGYYAGTAYAVVDGDVTENLYLQAESEGGSGFGVGYAPKTVRFTTQTMWGSPIQDCCVNCTGYETTVGSWEWLYTLFGVDVNETPVATAEMGGYTDYKGDINFVMFEPVKYECSFVKAGEINKTIEIYPKDDYYLILATDYGNASWLEGGVDINKAVTIAVTTETINSTAAYVIVNYTDTSSGTTGGTVYLNQTDPDDPAGPELNIDSYTITGSSFDTAFTVTDYSGESFFVRVRPVHSTWDFERDFAVTFPEEQFNPMGLTDTELAMIATFLILFAGCLFGAVSAPHAPLVMSFLGWLFLAFGWLDAVFATASISLVLATVMSIVYLIMIRSKKERWV